MQSNSVDVINEIIKLVQNSSDMNKDSKVFSAGLVNLFIMLQRTNDFIIGKSGNAAIKTHGGYWNTLYCSVQRILYDNNLCTADGVLHLLETNISKISTDVDIIIAAFVKSGAHHFEDTNSSQYWLYLFECYRNAVGDILHMKLNIKFGRELVTRLYNSTKSECAMNPQLQFLKPPPIIVKLKAALLWHLKSSKKSELQKFQEKKQQLIKQLYTFSSIAETGKVHGCSIPERIQRAVSIFLTKDDIKTVVHSLIKSGMVISTQLEGNYMHMSVVTLWKEIEESYNALCQWLGLQQPLLLRDLSCLGLWSCKSAKVGARGYLLSKYLQDQVGCSYSLPFLASQNAAERFLPSDPEMGKAVVHMIMLNMYEKNGIGKVNCVDCIKKQIPFSLILATLLGYINIAGMIGLICTGF